MPSPAISTAFGDLLDPRFQKIFNGEYDSFRDRVGELYGIEKTNGRNNMTFSGVGNLGDVGQFTGSVNYDTFYQGYDTTITPLEFASGFQVERKLFDDDQYNQIDRMPKKLAEALHRTRQKHAFRMLNNAFSVDTFFYNNTEAVALCSDSHTTTATGTSTASGFDNMITSSLSATALTAAKILGRSFTDDRGNAIDMSFDELWYPIDLTDRAEEILKSAGKVDTANNNINVFQGAFKGYDSIYLTDTNNWFMCDSRRRKMSTAWTDRVSKEFAMVEDFDTLVAKWRLYARYGAGHFDWRWVVGANVS